MADTKAILEETKEEAQYDAAAKKLLAQKPFLANILVRTVKDFMGMNPKDVELLIEGEPCVGNVPVEPGFTNSVLSSAHSDGQNGGSNGENAAVSGSRDGGQDSENDVLSSRQGDGQSSRRSDSPREITGMNNEDRVPKEGVLFYDVIFFVRTADGLSKVIVNLEAQKSEPVKYDVEMRGIFYAAREVSAQLEREFAHQQYNDIKKVYSIWICMNEPENTLEKIYLAKEDLIGHSRWKEMYEIINVVIVRLGKELDTQRDHELHRLLGTLFLPEMSVEVKNGILEEEFHIDMEGDRKELVRSMCNLSQGIKEQGIEEGILLGTKRGEMKKAKETVFSLARRNISVEDIADIVEVSTQTVQEWLSGADLVK